MSSTTHSRPMISRTGRDNQVYSPTTGARVVAGTIILNQDHSKVLLISATKKGFWVMPKGGVENDESGPQEAALREAFEESGAIGKVTKYLGKFEDARPPKTWQANTIEAANQTWPPRSEFHFFEVELEKLENKWPEGDKRERRWVSYSEAISELERGKRFELVQALDASSILKE